MNGESSRMTKMKRNK